MKPVLIRSVFFLLACLAASPAWAHAHLTGSIPAAGSQIAAAPDALTLRFTEAVEPRFCIIELRDSAGVAVNLDAPKRMKGNASALSVALPKLNAGTYTVVWHATSVDTHKTDGRYQFTIAP